MKKLLLVFFMLIALPIFSSQKCLNDALAAVLKEKSTSEQAVNSLLNAKADATTVTDKGPLLVVAADNYSDIDNKKRDESLGIVVALIEKGANPFFLAGYKNEAELIKLYKSRLTTELKTQDEKSKK